jgi:hypothetical protein
MDLLEIAEARLLLRRMDVKVHQLRLHLHQKYGVGKEPAVHHIGKGVFHRLHQGKLLEATSVYKRLDLLAVPANVARVGHKEGDPEPLSRSLQAVERLGRYLAAEESGGALFEGSRRKEESLFSVGHEAEANFRLRQRLLEKHLSNLLSFALRTLEKAFTGGEIVKEPLHGDGGSLAGGGSFQRLEAVVAYR